MAEQPTIKGSSATASTSRPEEEKPKKRGGDNLHQLLAEDLKALQARAEKFEDYALASNDQASRKDAFESAKHYREEAAKVRASLLDAHKAMQAELRR